MTQEEKAKAYDEALEKAKELPDSPRTCFDIEQLKDIFSELAKSEDERIRRAIVSLVYESQGTYKSFAGIDLDDMLAWLEKQKEQKHTLKFKVGDKVHLEGDEINILTITGIEEDRYLTDNSYGPILFGAEDIWEKVEQKPKCTAYLDLSSNEFEACMLRYLQSAVNRKDDAMIMIDTKEYAAQLMEIAMKEQKSAWSEEDEEMIKMILGDLEWERRNTTVDKDIRLYDEKIAFLKSLRPRLSDEEIKKIRSEEYTKGFNDAAFGDKSKEWSKDDEDTINLMIAILRENHPNGQFKTNPVNTTCMSVISTDMLIKRIESLRPQQKDEWSEEDESFLDSIEEAISAYYDLNHAPQYHYWLEEKLKSLRSQPKQEWSKEDETYRQDALWCVKQAYKLCKTENDTGSCWSAEKWLKSLKPQSKQKWNKNDQWMLDCIIEELYNTTESGEMDDAYPAEVKYQVKWLKKKLLNND